jgi:AIPR protein
MNFRIPAPAEHVRSIKDPNNESIRIVHAIVNINDLPQDIPLDPDPRRPKDKGAVPKRIISSLKTDDGRFHLLNRGITISVKHYDFDNKRNILTLTIPEEDERYGIIDGGHTYHAITKGVGEERLRLRKVADAAGTSGDGRHSPPETVFGDQFVHIEILEGIESHLADIAEARNFSVALKPWTLANYREKFEWLLEALGKDYARDTIRVSENDEQPVGILDVIQVLGAINPILFSEEKPAQDAYKNVGKLLDYFIEDEDRYGFRKLAPVSREILRLYDYIRDNFREKYNAPDEIGKRGLFLARKEAQEAQKKRAAKSKATYYWLDPLSGPKIGDAVIDKGLAIPLISGFRVLLEERDGVLVWLTDPIKFFDEYGTKLVRTIMNVSENVNNDPHTVGRDPQVYRQLTSEVRRWYLEGQIKKQSSLASV